MKLTRTAVIKLDMSQDEVLPTLKAYTNAFNFASALGYRYKVKRRNDLHPLCYYDMRDIFKLPSQLAVSCITKSYEAVKSTLTVTKHKKQGSCPKSSNCSIRLDKNSYSLFIDKKQVSILTISGRRRFSLKISDYHQHYFRDWKHTSADLCIRKNKVYLHIVFEKDEADIKSTNKFIGVDRGINNIAVSSNNQFFGGGAVKKQVFKYGRLRRSLQAKGTKSAKRHLTKLDRKERRFRADVNHQISKKIIKSLNPGDTIVLEDLTGIRNKRVNKTFRYFLNSWSFFQLEQFLIYKGMAKGISIEYIDARYTSQRCSSCSYICRGNRKTQSNFCCKSCGFKLNADLNGSRNIVMKHIESQRLSNGALVNEPNVAMETSAASYQPCAGSN